MPVVPDAPLPPPASDYLLMPAESQLQSENVLSVQVACGEGRKALSASWRVVGEDGAAQRAEQIGSMPTPDASGWEVLVRTEALVRRKLQVQVLCMKSTLLAGLEVVTVQTEGSSRSVMVSQPRCPVNMRAVGAGWSLRSAGNDFLTDNRLQQFEAADEAAGWDIQVQSGADPGWLLRLTSRVICVAGPALPAFEVVEGASERLASPEAAVTTSCPAGKRAVSLAWGTYGVHFGPVSSPPGAARPRAAVEDDEEQLRVLPLPGRTHLSQVSADGTSWELRGGLAPEAIPASGVIPEYRLRTRLLCTGEPQPIPPPADYQLVTQPLRLVHDDNRDQVTGVCPWGTRIVGAGWSVLDETGVPLGGAPYRLFPSQRGDSLTAFLESERDRGWQAQVQLACRNKQQLPGYELTETRVSLVQGRSPALETRCPEGKKALTVGWTMYASDLSDYVPSSARATYSEPLEDAAGWRLRVRDFGYGAGSADGLLVVRLVCSDAAGLPGLEVREAVSDVVLAEDAQQLEVQCPEDKRALGAGWGAFDPSGRVLESGERYSQAEAEGQTWRLRALLVPGQSTAPTFAGWKLRVRTLCL